MMIRVNLNWALSVCGALLIAGIVALAFGASSGSTALLSGGAMLVIAAFVVFARIGLRNTLLNWIVTPINALFMISMPLAIQRWHPDFTVPVAAGAAAILLVNATLRFRAGTYSGGPNDPNN